MTHAMDGRVLVLNDAWMPVNVVSLDDAMTMVLNQNDRKTKHGKKRKSGPRARFVDPDTNATYNFESWVETWDQAIKASKEEVPYKVLNSKLFSFRVPEVIVLVTGYTGLGDGSTKPYKGPPKFSRRNVYIRDKYTCQYCGRKDPEEGLNLEHVYPKSKGGDMTWKNIVLSCVPCNDMKRNRTPEEAGMTLIRKPYVPRPEELKQPFGHRLKRKLGKDVPTSWEQFLGKMYWNVELSDD